jgi:hypothetical protein
MTGITLATVGAGPLLEHCCAVASDHSAGMTTYHIGAAVTYVMRDQHLWNACLLQRVHLCSHVVAI